MYVTLLYVHVLREKVCRVGLYTEQVQAAPYLVSSFFDVLQSLHLVTLFLMLSSGNCISGSSSYSYLVDTWADSLCIHQLVPKPCSKSISTTAHSN